MNSFGPSSRVKLSSGQRPELAIIGGSGLCSFSELNPIEKVNVVTPYGPTSDQILIGEYAGKVVAFLPRHGEKHNWPPHHVPYKANLWALKEIGVRHIVATCIAGSLQEKLVSGSLVVLDQFVNLTWGRDDHFGTEHSFLHLPMANPYCTEMRMLLIELARRIPLAVIPTGTVAVIQGPRFSTQAESEWLAKNGWDLVNMTQYPECYFARELGLCYGAVAAITDYDVGVGKALTMDFTDISNQEEILAIFRNNITKIKRLLLGFTELASGRMQCQCAETSVKAYYED
ncbi:MAG: Purine nucleoside phosphorylase [Candidatus Woesebacteria bacterium GW2011_GWA1_39_21b]|uniref:Purine nucleoside phosphorylase n=2 Tax=Patescibacteria group TaxID=1783273 RepID=A0A1G2QFZ9_9BACT|nr:MAG: Purine nucleoside phosphorylase [Candidatus Woesebacteria bacterium GW2011_GWA1_39_21b]KKS77177.1 MAG: Purine nucleoside phosphorylase [Parcubacteria group bacterium GW2011_GWB1_42_9]KKS89753.1 MAG: Purine nucleoside phosphorylase [Parcubacteria group bacterium GW2011_GWC1_43_11b]OHA59303.1 MAG: hypothetical protein A2370_02010 [Candidatus Vogelbacteria bacterium RIFOXYB1_FULL_42_16]